MIGLADEDPSIIDTGFSGGALLSGSWTTRKSRRPRESGGGSFLEPWRSLLCWPPRYAGNPSSHDSPSNHRIDHGYQDYNL